MTTGDFDAEVVNWSFDQGDAHTFAISRTKSDGTAYDISSWTFWLTVKESRSDADSEAAIQKTVTSHTNPTNGETEIDITASDTDSLEGNYVYDMQYKTSASSDPKTFMKGQMYFDPDVTEAT